MIKKFKFKFELLLLITIFFGSTMVNATTFQCEKIWNNFYIKHSNTSILDKIGLWKENKSKCKPKGYYFFRLAKLYLSIEDFAKAKSNIEKGLKLKDQAFTLNQLMTLSIQFTELSHKLITDSDWPKLEAKTLSFTNKHPNLSEGHALLSSVKLARGDYEGAIQSAGRAAYLEGSLTPLTGRTLTISYTETKKYKQAIEVANGAAKMDNNLFRDKYFMLAAVRSYVGINDIDMASRSLKLLITSDKNLVNDSDVQKYARYLQKKLREREAR